MFVKIGTILGAIAAFLAIVAFVVDYNSTKSENKVLIAQAKTSPPVQVVPPSPDSNVERVSHLEKPNYEPFVFLKDIRVVDLRARQKIPESMNDERFSPATWTRYTLARKKREVGSISFQFATTGVGLDPRCLSHPYRLIRADEHDIDGDRIIKESWEVVVDVSDIPVGEDFLIINEATYWNGFRGEESEWASIKAQEGTTTEEIGILVLFPEEKPYKLFNMLAYAHGSDQKQQFQGVARTFPSHTKQSFYWKIDDPKPAYAYELEWTW